jgi:CHAT domain-containing protein
MSLWKVDDRETLAWMQRLYERRDAGMTTAEAVWQASLDSLKERRAKGRSTHPFYWGAFVAAGDWR